MIEFDKTLFQDFTGCVRMQAEAPQMRFSAPQICCAKWVVRAFCEGWLLFVWVGLGLLPHSFLPPPFPPLYLFEFDVCFFCGGFSTPHRMHAQAVSPAYLRGTETHLGSLCLHSNAPCKILKKSFVKLYLKIPLLAALQSISLHPSTSESLIFCGP